MGVLGDVGARRDFDMEQRVFVCEAFMPHVAQPQTPPFILQFNIFKWALK